MTTRREFLRRASRAGLALGAFCLADPLSTTSAMPSPEEREWPNRPFRKGQAPRKLLILGGTAFLGPHVVNVALERGHEITLFNRGQTNPHLFPDLEKLRGDRDGDLAALEGRKWDAVIDTSGYVPRVVKASAELLADAVQQYVFISTKSVYAGFPDYDMDETAPVGTLEDQTVEEITGETYGPLKALCEQAAEATLPGRVTNIRPGLIVGPRDRSDRFTYWPVRVARGGEVLAPVGPDVDVQWIDVRDLADWIIHALEREIVGVYNTVTPSGSMQLGHVLNVCRKVSGSDARFTWVDAKFLEEHEVQPYREIPLWVNAVADYRGFARVSSRKAVARGLCFRSVQDTAADTLAWFRTLPEERQKNLKAGLTPEREAKLLAAWGSREHTG